MIDDTLMRWLKEIRRFCMLIGSPGARAHIAKTTKYYVCCFVALKFRASGLSCVIDAAYNAGYVPSEILRLYR